MISVRRIFPLRRICLINSLSSTVTNSTLIPVHNQCRRGRNIVRRLEFVSFRNYGSQRNESIPDLVVEKNKNGEASSELEIELSKKQMDFYQERCTIGVMLSAMYHLASKHLLDPKFRLANDLTSDMWFEENSCYDYWIAVFERSRTPLAIELDKILKNAGIPYEDFCRTIVKIYFTLDAQSHFTLPDFKIESVDVINAIRRLGFDNKQYEYLRILFSLHDTYGWKI